MMGTIGIKANNAVAPSQGHRAPAKRPPQNKTPVVRHSLGTGELRGVGEVKASGQHRSSGHYANRERETASSVLAPSSSTHLKGHQAVHRGTHPLDLSSGTRYSNKRHIICRPLSNGCHNQKAWLSQITTLIIFINSSLSFDIKAFGRSITNYPLIW